MRLVIGETTNRGAAYRPDAEPQTVEARLLEVRDRRDSGVAAEGGQGKVLVLLVTEGHKIPKGLESGDYRLFLRFVHRRFGR